MISKTGTGFDIIIVTAEYYDDHPCSPAGVIARVLDAEGYSVGIIEKPVTNEDFTRLGAPKLFFGVTSGSIDSMLNNYTPLKKLRGEDENSCVTPMPDRAVTVYCNKLRENFKGCKLVIGGIEASLRRFAHYDYWENRVRKSVLFDTRADILVYGNGELQIIEIARRFKQGEKLNGIEGTCIIGKELPENFERLPSFMEASTDKTAFCKMQNAFSNSKNLAQEYDNNFVLQYKSPRYTTEDLDRIYSLDYTRKMHPKSLLKMAQFSVVTHRGCIGACNFCAITLHQGDKIISRSEKNILDEIRKLTKHPDFKGHIDDLGGPSANMYGMDCAVKCGRKCLGCAKLDRTHNKMIALLRKAREIPGVKRIFIRSGIRYDLALENKEYIREVSEHHISGCLKIAPEHFSETVIKLMGKDNSRFDEFLAFFAGLNKGKRQELRYYLMICHPGDDPEQLKAMQKRLRTLKNIDQFQMFTPTPMTTSTCMYWTGLNPETLKPVKVVYDYNTKKKMKRAMLEYVDAS